MKSDNLDLLLKKQDESDISVDNASKSEVAESDRSVVGKRLQKVGYLKVHPQNLVVNQTVIFLPNNELRGRLVMKKTLQLQQQQKKI